MGSCCQLGEVVLRGEGTPIAPLSVGGCRGLLGVYNTNCFIT